MLRITMPEAEDPAATIRLEGEVSGPWVDELRRLCGVALRRRRRLVLDLARVRFVDRKGVALLRRLMTGPVHLTGCSAFVAELLKG
jgi:hypothetical protein